MLEPAVAVWTEAPGVDEAAVAAAMTAAKMRLSGGLLTVGSAHVMAQSLRGGSGRALWLRGRRGRPMAAPLKVTAAQGAVSIPERELEHLSALTVAAKSRRMAVLVAPPALLVEHAWRQSVWDGGSVSLDEFAAASAGPLAASLRRVLDVTSPLSRRVLAPVEPSPGAAPSDDWWKVSARGVEILRRLNAHAADKKERRLMRGFVAETFPSDAATSAGGATDLVDRLVDTVPELAAVWPRQAAVQT